MEPCIDAGTFEFLLFNFDLQVIQVYCNTNESY
jgi:hypothetical protein